MVKIRPLTHLTTAMLDELNRGYTSTAKYVVRKVETYEHTAITLDLVPLETPYVKQWVSDEQELVMYQGFVKQGHSLAAYDGERIVGIALTEARWWNRTLWVWEFHVAEDRRGQGVGRTLMEALAQRAHEIGFRILGLETQSTNVPAIAFYRKVGFEIGSLDLSYYTNTDAVNGEVAIFMKRKLSGDK